MKSTMTLGEVVERCKAGERRLTVHTNGSARIDNSDPIAAEMIEKILRQLTPQIESPPQSVTLAEVCELVNEMGCASIRLFGDTSGRMMDNCGDEWEGTDFTNEAELLAVLKRLAEPPEEFVMIKLRKSEAEVWAQSKDSQIGEACREALKGGE